MKRWLQGGALVFLVLAALGLAGCEEDVVAVLGTEEAYTLWGVLSPLADTQFVRVFPVEGTLNPGVAEPLDARFVSTNLDTGEERRWRDSVIVDARGIVGHVFYTPFQVEYEHAYHLEITGAEERSSSVDVTVPAQTNLTLGEPDTTQGVLLPIYVLNNPPRLVRSELEFSIGYITGFTSGGCPLYTTVQITLPYDTRVRPTDDGWWFVVNLGEVYGFVRALVEEDPFYSPQFGITLMAIQFNTIVANEAWAPPEGLFDPDVLVQPGTMSNVENGFGFVGAGYRLSSSWQLMPRVVNLSGFRADYELC